MHKRVNTMIDRLPPVLGLGLLFVALMTLVACSYETLSCFFDGVPDPNAPVVTAGRAGPVRPNRPRRRTGPKEAFYYHTPYSERQCTGCHSQTFSNELITTKDKLCDRCHAGIRQAPDVHGPVALGGCLGCHHPHGSVNKALLLTPATEMCMNCHDDTFQAEAIYHADRGDRNCISCHNAHVTTLKSTAWDRTYDGILGLDGKPDVGDVPTGDSTPASRPAERNDEK